MFVVLILFLRSRAKRAGRFPRSRVVVRCRWSRFVQSGSSL